MERVYGDGLQSYCPRQGEKVECMDVVRKSKMGIGKSLAV